MLNKYKMVLSVLFVTKIGVYPYFFVAASQKGQEVRMERKLSSNV